MPSAGHLGVRVYNQNTAPIDPTPGDFWFDTSGATQLNFRTSNSWLLIVVPTAALDTLSNAVSALSNAVSVISQAISAQSNSISVLSQAQSVLSNAQSVLSNAVSVLSQSVSALSNSVSVLSNAVSVISNSLSVLSQQVSVISQQVSVLSGQVVSVISLHNALSQVVSIISVTLSALSTAVSVISAGIGGVQMRWVSTAQGISSTAAAGVAISGLSISVAVGVYEVVGKLLVTHSVLDAFGLSFTFPAMAFAAGKARGYTTNAQTVSVITGTFDEGGSNSIFYSVIVSAISTFIHEIDAIFNVSTAGTIQLNARVSAATKPSNIVAGSFLRAHRIV